MTKINYTLVAAEGIPENFVIPELLKQIGSGIQFKRSNLKIQSNPNNGFKPLLFR